MAQRRMISKSISTSRKLSRVSDFAALLFTWIIPHCDDYGHLDGSPELVKAIVVPLRSKTVEEIETALKELITIELIYTYRQGEDIYLSIVKWEDYQTFKNLEQRVAKFPLPSDETPAKQDNTIKVNLIKDNISLLTPYSNNTKLPSNSSHSVSKETVQQVYEAYKTKISGGSRLTQPAAAKIRSRLQSYTVDDLLEGIENFSKNNWWMQNNSDKGIAWFFSSDNRIDMFLSLKPEKQNDPLDLK